MKAVQDTGVSSGSMLTEISNAMVSLHKEQFGRGPTRARTSFAGSDLLICVLEDVLLPAERALVDMGQRPDGVLAPQQGITRDPKGGATAMVVTADGTVEARVVTANRTVGDQWLVDAGLQPGDRVIVEGLQKIAPGAKANPIERGDAPAEAATTADEDA